MMKKLINLSYLFFLFNYSWLNAQSPAEFVNPFIGTSTSVEGAGVYHGLGKTFPGAAYPFGMVQVSPNTITGGDNGSGYSYEHTSIEWKALSVKLDNLSGYSEGWKIRIIYEKIIQ